MSAEPNVKPQRTADPALPPSDLTSTEKSTKLPVAPEMPGSEKDGSNAKHINLPYFPTDIKAVLNTTDDTLARLNKVLKAPGGLQSFLSTANYGLYILAHLHATSPSRAQVLGKLSSYLGRTPSKAPASPASASAAAAAGVPATPLLPLALTIGDLRTTLRLIGLIPLYALLKSLIQSPDPDTPTRIIKLAQCSAYMTFQLLENIYHLTNKTVITTNWTNARFARLGGNAKLMTWSCRAWLTGISCDFLRLFREAQLARQQSSKYRSLSDDERKEADRKWYSELFVAMSWYPMAIHYSVEGGIGLNLGMVGTCGFLANLGNFLKLWEATK